MPASAADQGATLEIQVERAGVDSAGAAPSDLRVVHYEDGALETLETDVERATGDTVTLSAAVSSFSPFAVVVRDDDAGGTTNPTPTPRGTPTPPPEAGTPAADQGSTATAESGDAVSTDTPAGPAQRATPTPTLEPGGFGVEALAGVVALIVASVAGLALYRRRRV